MLLYAAAQPVYNEPLRRVALRAIFSGMQLTVAGDQKINDPSPKKPESDPIGYPDAFLNTTVYQIVGKPTLQAEKLAAQDISNETLSNTRRVRLRLLRWPREGPNGLVAVLQYDFAGAKPALSCPSLGLLIHLTRNAFGVWQVRDGFLLNTSHHFSLQRIEMLDLTGGGVNELVVESDFGGAGSAGSSLQVFELGHGRFEEILSSFSCLEYMDQEGYIQVLDIKKTRQRHGQQFCTTKTTIFEKGEWFKTPRVSYPCYNNGHGIDAEESRVRDNLMAPVN